MARRVRVSLPVAQARQIAAAARTVTETGTLAPAARVALEKARETIEVGIEEMVDGCAVTFTMSEAHAAMKSLGTVAADEEALARLFPSTQQLEAFERAVEKLAQAIREA